MGTIVDFPDGAALRRAGSSVESKPRETSATILILPAIRIERHPDETRGPEEGAAPGRRRKRRARS